MSKKNQCSSISPNFMIPPCDCNYTPPPITFSNWNKDDFREGAIITSDDGRKFMIMNIDGNHVALKLI